MGQHKGHAPSNTKGSPGYVWYNNGEKETLVKPGTLLEGDGWKQGRLYQLEEARSAVENRYNGAKDMLKARGIILCQQ